MNVYLFDQGNPSLPWLYSEDPLVVVSEVSAGRRQARSRLERLARALKAAWWRTHRRVGPRLQRVLDGLNRPAPDGPLLRSLRRAERIRLHHPARLSAEGAQLLWHREIARRQRREIFATVGNLLLAALAVPLMVLPGPNVVGYWFLWRATLHGLAVFGTWRVRSRRIPVETIPLDALNEPLDRHDEAQVVRMAAACGLRHLSATLRRQEQPGQVRAEVAEPSV